MGCSVCNTTLAGVASTKLLHFPHHFNQEGMHILVEVTDWMLNRQLLLLRDRESSEMHALLQSAHLAVLFDMRWTKYILNGDDSFALKSGDEERVRPENSATKDTQKRQFYPYTTVRST